MEPYIKNIHTLSTEQIQKDLVRFEGAKAIQEYHLEYGNVEEDCNLARSLVSACRRELNRRNRGKKGLSDLDLKVIAS